MSDVEHRVLIRSVSLSEGSLIEIGSEEAFHAVRVKRTRVGDAVEVLNGAGDIGLGRVEAVGGSSKGGATIMVRIEGVRREEPARPRLEVCSAVPKGGRLDDMVGGLSQVGAARWCPLGAERSIVSPRPAKVERVSRLAAEASKQCGRAWILETGDQIGFSAALAAEPADVRVVIADASGGRYTACGAERVRLLVGPEGGWTEGEVATARESGATVARFGCHVMRIEVAAVVCAGIIMELEGAPRV